MNEFEDKLHEDLHQFLLSMKEVDERLPECPDVGYGMGNLLQTRRPLCRNAARTVAVEIIVQTR